MYEVTFATDSKKEKEIKEIESHEDESSSSDQLDRTKTPIVAETSAIKKQQHLTLRNPAEEAVSESNARVLSRPKAGGTVADQEHLPLKKSKLPGALTREASRADPAIG